MKVSRVTGIFGVISALTGTMVSGASPFSDVSPDSWAYQSVRQLAEAGIISGYPDGTYKGQHYITRYEMAQMVAKGLANEDRANAEQQAVLNRLTQEFSNELSTLGVRVTNLEERAGHVSISGDVRINYIGKDSIDSYDADHTFTNRVRLWFSGKVNPHTTVKVRLSSGSMELGDSAKPSRITDLAYVEHSLGRHVTVDIGRYNQKLGNGLIYSSNFDGAGVTAKFGKATVNAGYGYMTAGRFSHVSKENNGAVGVINLSADVHKHFHIGGMYAHAGKANVRMANGLRHNEFNHIYGLHVAYNAGKFTFDGEWVKAGGLSDSDVWNLGIQWGDYKITKKNSWTVRLDYFDQAKNAPVFKTQKYETNDQLKSSRFEGYTAWQAGFFYAPEHNVRLDVFYGFRGKTHAGNKVNNYLRADLLMKF